MLGWGLHREVYEFLPDPTKVIKIARNEDGRAANILERKLFYDLLEGPIVKWFAPVYDCSVAGEFLIMQRAEPLPHEQYPKKIPHFFTDTKYSNFGWIKGRGFVCIDLASFNLYEGVSTKMRVAKWWE